MQRKFTNWLPSRYYMWKKIYFLSGDKNKGNFFYLAGQNLHWSADLRGGNSGYCRNRKGRDRPASRWHKQVENSSERKTFEINLNESLMKYQKVKCCVFCVLKETTLPLQATPTPVQKPEVKLEFDSPLSLSELGMIMHFVIWIKGNLNSPCLFHF